MSFSKGQSGNPEGRPPGIKDRRARSRELFDAHRAGLIEKAVELALAGDTQALRMCLDRIVPPMKAPVVDVDLQGETLAERARSILDLLATGDHSVQEVLQMMQALATMAKVIDVDEFDRRLIALETAHAQR